MKAESEISRERVGIGDTCRGMLARTDAERATDVHAVRTDKATSSMNGSVAPKKDIENDSISRKHVEPNPTRRSK